jgi:hypothetical protein
MRDLATIELVVSRRVDEDELRAVFSEEGIEVGDIRRFVSEAAAADIAQYIVNPVLQGPSNVGPSHIDIAAAFAGGRPSRGHLGGLPVAGNFGRAYLGLDAA